MNPAVLENMDYQRVKYFNEELTKELQKAKNSNLRVPER